MSAACCGRKCCARRSAIIMGKRIDDAAFAKIQDECIRDVVKMQEDVGLKVVTDGEFRRGSYWGRFVERIDGFAIKPAVFKFRDDQGHEVDFTAPYADGKLQPQQAAGARRVRIPARDHQGRRRRSRCRRPRPCISTGRPISRRSPPMPTSRASSPIWRASSARRSPISPRPAAAISSSTRSRSRYCAIRRSASRSKPQGMKPDELVDLYIESINDCGHGRAGRCGVRRAYVPRQFQGALSRGRRL